MAIRNKLRACATQFFEPGETVTQVFEAQVGNPWVLHGLQGLGIGIAVSIGSHSGKYPGISQMLVLFAMLLCLATVFGLTMRKPRAVIVTDRAVLLLQMRKLTTKAEKLIIRLPRDTRFGPVPGAFTWAKVELLHENLFVSGRFRKDIAATNAGIPERRPVL